MENKRNKNAAMHRGDAPNDCTNYFLLHMGFYQNNQERDDRYKKKALAEPNHCCARLNGRVL